MSESLSDLTNLTIREKVAAELVRAEGFDPHPGDIENWIDHADRVLEALVEPVAVALWDRAMGERNMYRKPDRQPTPFGNGGWENVPGQIKRGWYREARIALELLPEESRDA